MFLERQLHLVDGAVSALEEQLAQDAALPDTPGALQARSQKLQVMTSS